MCSHTQKGPIIALNIKTTKDKWPQRANSHADQDINIFKFQKIIREPAFKKGVFLEMECGINF